MTRNVYGRGYELLSRSTDQNLEGKTYYHTDLYGSPFMAVDTEGSSNWHAEQEMLSAEESRAREAEDTSMEEEVEAGVTVAVTGSALGMNPKNARYGAGQYLPDIKPNSQTSASLAKRFINVPNKYKYTCYVEIDVTNLNVNQDREGVFAIPNSSP